MSFLVPALMCVVLTSPSNQDAASNLRGQRDATQQKTADVPDDTPPTPEHQGFRALLEGLKDDIRHLPSRENLYIAGLGGGLALGTHPFDHSTGTWALNHDEVVNRIFAPGQYVGDTPEQMAWSIGTWILGRVMDKPRMAHLGMDLLRAQAVTEILVQPIKFATRRERPDRRDRQSFPSGHAAVTFATAAVVQRHLGWKPSLVAYAIASYVAASRIHDNRHYLSDVVFGAAVGSIAGRTVTTHGRETWTLAPMAVPGGVAIVATRTGF